jgi:hypothetical protein
MGRLARSLGPFAVSYYLTSCCVLLLPDRRARRRADHKAEPYGNERHEGDRIATRPAWHIFPPLGLPPGQDRKASKVRHSIVLTWERVLLPTPRGTPKPWATMESCRVLCSFTFPSSSAPHGDMEDFPQGREHSHGRHRAGPPGSRS